MTFLAPWFLIGTLAAAIPLVLHLRRSRRRNRIVFSTTRFFDEQFLRTARRARVQDRLLMLLRMALFILFALALAQPLIHIPGLTGLLGLSGPRNVAIVFDDSASMSAADARGSQLARAKSAALALIDNLSAGRGDRVTLVLAGRRDGGPRVVFDPPTADLDQARRAVDAITATDLATDVNAAVARAADVLGTSSHHQQICVVSDFTASALPAADTIDPGATRSLMLVDVRPDSAKAAMNVSIDAVQYDAPRPMRGVPFTFRAMLTNHSSQSLTTHVRLMIDGQVAGEHKVEIPGGRSRITRFTHRFDHDGWHGGRVEIDPADPAAADAIPADNQRYFALHVAGELRIATLGAAPSSSPAADPLFFFRTALSLDRRSDGMTIDPLAVHGLSADKLAAYPVLVMADVADLPPDSLDAVEHYVDAGGSLLIALGDKVDVAAYNRWLGDEHLHGGLLPAKLLRQVDTGSGGFAAWADPSHPLTAGFDSGEFGDLSAIHFDHRVALEPVNADVLMRADDDSPVLVEKRFGRGRVILFASTLDRSWTNLPLEPMFVPWVYRMVGYLAEPPVGGSGFYRTGQTVQLPQSVTQVNAVRVDTPAGPSFVDSSMKLTQTDHAGLYTVRSTASDPSSPPQRMFAVNIPHEESRLSYLDKSAMATRVNHDASWAWVDAPENVASAVQLAEQGYGVWDLLLVLALMVGLFEPWLANVLARRREQAEGHANPSALRDVAAPERAGAGPREAA